ncbi:MAG: TonB-dependent receptor [Gemmatimonadaceae bacterium]|nr:TonB-dependent receptor [Gemmatimonadaceae bacterium]
MRRRTFRSAPPAPCCSRDTSAATSSARTKGFGAGWGNKAATLRWNQAIGGRLFSKLTTAFGDYDYRLEFVVDPQDSVTWRSRIRSVDVKLDETLYLSENNAVEFGLQFTDQEFRPGKVAPTGRDSRFQGREVAPRFGIAPAAYFGQDLKFGTRYALRYGLRYAGFVRQGSATIYRYRDEQAVVYNPELARYEPGEVVDSVTYRRGQRVASFGGWEPRVSGRIMLSEAASVKASYARTQQFLLLASKTNSISPLDVWEPVGPYVKPQVADQYAIGYTRATSDYELSVEAYYKRARQVVDFIDGADVILNPRVETLLVQGEGRAYGVELLARRATGTLTGWISYTLGRSEQRFPLTAPNGAAPGGGINGGRYFPGPFDKTHNLSVVAIRPLGRKWTLGSTFALSSSLPATFPVARYQVDGLLVTEYGPRNASRLPLYHRLDLSATRTFRRGELQLGVLNAYNRFNAQALRFRQQVDNPLVAEAVQTSIFGIVPSITDVFRF